MVSACRTNEVTDFILLTETLEEPDGMIVSHLPHGPTAYFTLFNIDTSLEYARRKAVSEVNPKLVIHNLTTCHEKRALEILRYIFPVPGEDSEKNRKVLQ